MPSTPVTVEENRISDLIDRVAVEGDRLVVLREGKKVAAVAPLEDLVTLEELDDLLEEAEIEAAREEARTEGTVPLAEVKTRLSSSRPSTLGAPRY
ncbi:MAG: type II toxin-antitoxin system Phd/YefM family antitoxin [Thermodesulfobacteriota bacterium]